MEKERILQRIQDKREYLECLVKMMRDRRHELTDEKWQSYYRAAYRESQEIEGLEAELKLLDNKIELDEPLNGIAA